MIFRLYYDLSANTNGRTAYENIYQKQLFALANKYNALDDKLTINLEKSEYTRSDLLTVVSRINNISKAEFNQKYTEHSKVSCYVSAAANISTTSSDAGSSYTAGGGVPYTSYEPAIAVGIDFVPDPNGGRAEFRADFSIDPAQMNALYQLKVSPYVGAKTAYSQTAIGFTPQALFNVYNAANFKFFLGFGVRLSYYIYSNAYFEDRTSATNPYFPKEPFYFNKLDNSFLFKAGFRIHKNFEVFFNYLTGTATTGGGYFALSKQDKQIGISYFWGK